MVFFLWFKIGHYDLYDYMVAGFQFKINSKNGGSVIPISRPPYIFHPLDLIPQAGNELGQG
jgi:hypothetical protein